MSIILAGLMNQWVGLRIKSLKLQEYRKLQKQILEMKISITSIAAPDTRRFLPQNYPVEDIHNEIEVCNVSICLISSHYSIQHISGIIEAVYSHRSAGLKSLGPHVSSFLEKIKLIKIFWHFYYKLYVWRSESCCWHFPKIK